LLAGFAIPIHVIAADAFMVSPNSLLEVKKWPPWERICWAKDKDVKDHPWYNLREPALPVPPAPTTTPVTQVKGKEKERNEDMDSGKLGEHTTFIIPIDFCSEEPRCRNRGEWWRVSRTPVRLRKGRRRQRQWKIHKVT